MALAVQKASQANELRVVIFTAGPLSPVNRVFFERLARDPRLDLRGIVVDDYEKPKKALWTRIRKGLERDGWPWIAFKVRSGLERLIHGIGARLFELIHPVTRWDESYQRLQEQTGVPVYRVADIHSDQSLALIRSLRPQLGLIVGGRILKDSVLSIPERGTLNIHKRKVPDYRGGGPVGYWEVLAGESLIGVTIHYAIPRVDSGPVVAQTTIPIEECDTLESLKIKADIVGARLYRAAVIKIAGGFKEGIPQDPSQGKTYRSPSDYKIWQLERQLKQRQVKGMPCWRDRPSELARARMFLQYFVLLPLLHRVKRRLLKEHRAPICIFFYHLVTNRPVNHLGISLEEFVREIEFLRRYYRLVSLPEALEHLRSNENGEVAAAITFDDGYRDNRWAVQYLTYFQIPAAFFVSVGHVREGRSFEHDREKGFHEASPLSEAHLRRLACDGFLVGSHGVYHEDFGTLDAPQAEKALSQSRQLIACLTGKKPEHFSFPKGQRCKNITRESFALAQKHYPYVFSAYGGYNFPQPGRRHFLRIGNPADVLELAMVMDGYTGFRQILRGNAWGLKTNDVPPY